jgi:hypothetical protein
MAIGLGFANPELQRAQLLASLNGSTAIPKNVMAVGKAQQMQPSQMPQPQMPAMPSAASMATAAPTASVQMPQIQPPPIAAPQQPQPEKKGPGFYETAGALGHIILSIDAGLRNQPMPDPPGGDPRAQQDQEMQVQEFVMNTAARAWEAMRKAPPEMRASMMKQFQDAIQKVAPDFDLPSFIEGLMDDSDWVDEIAPEVAVMSEEAKSMFMSRVRQSGEDPAAAAGNLLKDREFMDGLRAYDDDRNVPVLKFKLQKVRAAMTSMQMDPATFAGMTMEDFARINENLPESVRLSPSELATMKRRPELGGIIGLTGSPGRAAPIDRGGPPSMETATGYSKPEPPRYADRRPAPQASEAPRAAPEPARPLPPASVSAPQARTAPQKPQTQKASPKPNYPPGWNPDLVTKVEVVGKRPSKAAKEKPPQRERRVVIPRDMNIPGYGRVKKGDALIYNYETGEYRKG